MQSWALHCCDGKEYRATVRVLLQRPCATVAAAPTAHQLVCTVSHTCL